MKKVLLRTISLGLLTASLFFGFINPTASSAAPTIVSREEAKLDESFVKEDSNYVSPQKIAIVPIKRPTDLTMEDGEWYEGIYYFYTARLGFPDIPFHYVVGSDGQIFEGNKGGDEQRIFVQNADPGMLVVGYLQKENEDNFSLNAMSGLSSIILELANRNSIKLENIQVLGVETVVNLKDKSVFLRKKDIFGSWNNGLKDIINSIKGQYAPVPKEYSLEIVEATSPSETVAPGDSPVMTLKIKNNSKYNIYEGTDSEILGIKKDGSDSKFFVNGLWASPKQPSLMETGSILKSGETATFKFKMSVPLFFGAQSETFTLANVGGAKFTQNEFAINLNVGSIDKKVVEILTTSTGYLNVRTSPFGSGEVFTKVNPGQRYIFLEDSGTGWVKIDLGNGTTGWVARQYITFVN